MGNHRNNHRKALEKIANHPDKFGLPPISDKVTKISTEENLYHRGSLIAQPDVILETEAGDVYIIEFKGYGNGELYERARRQLEQAKWWYGRHRQNILSTNIHTLIISGDDQKYADLLRGLSHDN